MRWLVIAILAYACLVIETTFFRPGALGIQVHGQSVRPDLVLVLGVFFALVYEPYEVFVLGWCLGLAADVVAPYERFGVAPLLFGVVLYVLSYLQGSLFRTRVLTQFLLSLGVVFAVHAVWEVAAMWSPGSPLALGRAVEGAAYDAIYSAILAPYLFWLVFRLRTPLRLPAGSTLE